MKRISEEAEVIARLDYVSGETNITVVSWPAMARRMERLYGKPTDGHGQVQRWKVKGLTMAFRKPRRKAILAPAEPFNRGFSKPSAAGKGIALAPITERQNSQFLGTGK